jgi:Ca2+-binding RTX toxin-like protein
VPALVLTALLGTGAVAEAAAPQILNASGSQWMESDAGVGSGANNTSREIYFTFVVKRDPGQPVTQVQADIDYNGSTFDNPVNVTSQSIQSVGNGYVIDRVSGYVQGGDTGGFSCPVIGTRTRRHTRPVRFRVVGAGGTSGAVSYDMRWTTTGTCLGSQDFAYLRDRSQSATTAAPGQTVSFTYTGDDPDSDENFDGIRYRFRNQETGATSGTTKLCGNTQYGDDNTARTVNIAMPNARGRYVVEAELYSTGCNDNDDIMDGGRWWRLGAVDVNHNANPAVSLSGVPARAGGPGKASFTATASASDPGGAIHVVEWDVDNAAGFEVFNFTNGTWPNLTVGAGDLQRTVNAAAFAHGTTVTVRARARDNGAITTSDASARSTEASATFVVDKVAPAATVASPANGAATNDATPTISGAAGNAAGDDAVLPVKLYAGPTATGSPLQTANVTRTGTSWSWTPAALADGEYTVTVDQNDDAGNDGAIATSTFTVDTSTPTLDITGGPAPFSTQTTNDLGVTFDVGGDPTSVECRLDGWGWEDCSSGTVALDDLHTGGHWFEVRASDAAGNTATETRFFIVDPTGARVCSITDADGGAVAGTAGPDVICAAGGAYAIDGGGGDDVVYGGTGADTLDGGTGSDQLFGGPGDDALAGGSDAGTDRMDGGAGADTFAGGPGIDRVLYDTRTSGVTVTIGSGADDGQAGEGDDVGADVESVTGGEGTDTLTGDDQPNTFSGRGGDDTISGGDANDFMGGAKNGNHTFHGGDGVDRVTYTHYAAADAVNVTVDGVANDGAAGESDDVGTDVEYVYGTPGDDTLSAEGNAFGVSLWGYAGDDTLIGSEGADALYGMEGDDELQGRGGIDILRGDAGADTLIGGAGSDELSCGADLDAYELDAEDTFNPLPLGDCETPLP